MNYSFWCNFHIWELSVRIYLSPHLIQPKGVCTKSFGQVLVEFLSTFWGLSLYFCPSDIVIDSILCSTVLPSFSFLQGKGHEFS